MMEMIVRLDFFYWERDLGRFGGDYLLCCQGLGTSHDAHDGKSLFSPADGARTNNVCLLTRAARVGMCTGVGAADWIAISA